MVEVFQLGSMTVLAQAIFLSLLLEHQPALIGFRRLMIAFLLPLVPILPRFGLLFQTASYDFLKLLTVIR